MADGLFTSERPEAERAFDKNLAKIATRAKRNRNRYFRRKRSRRNYKRAVREARVRRRNSETRSLAEVSVLDLAAMTNERYPELPKEVSDWQYYHQLAYWKSRAVSLEFENRMLHAHLKRMCSKEIQDYVDYFKTDVDGNSSSCENTEEKKEEEEAKEDCPELYGSSQSKINAMETAMEVNFKMQVDNKRAVMWPNIPLNL